MSSPGHRSRRSAPRAGPRARAGARLAVADSVAAELRRRLVVGDPPRRPRVAAVGSARRRAPVVRDLDFLVVVPRGVAFATALATAALRPPRAGDRLAFGPTYAAGPRRRGLLMRWAAPGRVASYRADLFAAAPAERPFALFHFTGSREYTIRVRAHAKRRGWRLNQYGLFDARGRPVRGSAAVRSERGVARLLGVTYRPPEARRG